MQDIWSSEIGSWEMNEVQIYTMVFYAVTLECFFFFSDSSSCLMQESGILN